MSIEQLEPLVTMIRSAPALGSGDVEAMRASSEAMGALLPVDPETQFEPAVIAGVRAEWARAPGSQDGRAVIHLHGGGYVSGSIAVYRSFAANLSRASRAPLLVVDYRLAPEHRFPAGLDDAIAIYNGVVATGIPPARIAVSGDSAGGGLAAALLLALRERDMALPGAAALLSPMLDLAATGESMDTKAADDPMVQRPNVLAAARHYVGDGDPRTPLASPLYADPRGLPPLLIQVGTAECLLDDSRRFAVAARAAGVDVTLEEWPRMIHVWQLFAAMLDEGREAIDNIGRFLLSHLR